MGDNPRFMLYLMNPLLLVHRKCLYAWRMFLLCVIWYYSCTVGPQFTGMLGGKGPSKKHRQFVCLLSLNHKNITPLHRGLHEEDLPDIVAIKDRLDKLEKKPDDLKPILENVHKLRDQLLENLETVHAR